MKFEIKNIDCNIYIRQLKIENNTPIFDAIITDPPYNISRKNNFKTINRNGIDFGKWDYNFDQIGWIRNVEPLLKNGGSIIIFNDWKNMGLIASELDKLNFEVKDLIRWIKNNPMPRNINRRYLTDFEFAIWAIKKGKKWTFNKTNNTSYLRPEFKYSIVPKSFDKIHPTQKPIALLENLIKIHTNKDDLIFDPFMGSGSTAIAALNLNRNFVGCEIDKSYFEKAKERILKICKNKIKMSNKVIRSPLYYLGDKYKLVPQLVNYFPNNINKFYDVFSGGGHSIS